MMTESLILRQDTGKGPSKVKESELDDILKIRGVSGAFLIGNDGSIINASGWLDLDCEGLSASSLRLAFESGIIADRVVDGPMIQVFLEFERAVLIIQETDHDRLIAVIARPDANIGQISFHMKKHRQSPVLAV
jgi:predicted regulator of Ras-like GTPase activity (Roadblock/LC7/MglB family)